jgi:hypothetical protein
VLRVRAVGPEGEEVLSRLAITAARGLTVVTVALTRDCRGVECPLENGDPTLAACLAGVCVDPRCTVETPEFCGPLECAANDDCEAPPAACAEAVCLEGVCLEGSRPDACGPMAWCHPELGCQPPSPPPPDAGVDAGPPDLDAGPDLEDAGPPDLDAGPDLEDAGPPDLDADADADAQADAQADAGPDDAGPPPVRSGLAVWYGATAGPRYATFDGSFAAPRDAAGVGDWRIIAGAHHPRAAEAVLLGVTEAERVTAMTWDGASWSLLPGSPLSSITVSYYWAFDAVYETVSGDALVVWNQGTSGTSGLAYRTGRPGAWSPDRAAVSPTAGEPRQMHLAPSPNTDEAVLVVNASGTDYGLVWDGAAWGHPIVLDGSGGDTDVAVAYEGVRGRAIVVYGKSSGASAFYRIWDGTSWSTEGTIAPPAGDPPRVRWSMLAADPGSDRLAYAAQTIAADGSSQIWLSRWDGAAWSPGTLVTTSHLSNLNYPTVAVAFESTTGDALAAYTVDASTRQVAYRTWAATATDWSAEQPGPDLGVNANSLTLTADPSSARVMLLAQGSDSSLHAGLFDGVVWGLPTRLESDTTETKNQPFLFLWR